MEAGNRRLPVILSDNCGARELQIRSGVNGFVVQSNNPRGLAHFMHEIAEDEGLWTSMCAEALLSIQDRTSDKFARSVLTVARLSSRSLAFIPVTLQPRMKSGTRADLIAPAATCARRHYPFVALHSSRIHAEESPEIHPWAG